MWIESAARTTTSWNDSIVEPSPGVSGVELGLGLTNGAGVVDLVVVRVTDGVLGALPVGGSVGVGVGVGVDPGELVLPGGGFESVLAGGEFGGFVSVGGGSEVSLVGGGWELLGGLLGVGRGEEEDGG